jgi:glycosyltransferase involved in cell wall biosynthesis
MDISVIIRCGDDNRVFKCIESIDEEVEVIVSISENPKLESELRKNSIKYCISPRKNLSKTSNIGFELASHDKVIITDSDTLFESGCIKRLFEVLDDYKIACAGINFLSDPHILFSNVVAEARDYVNSLPLFYTPGIAVKKEILNEIGGFLFDNHVPYAVDANLNYRIKKAVLSVAWLKDEARLSHAPETIKHDLRAAFRIGMGCRAGIERLRCYEQYSDIKWNDLKGVKFSSIIDVFKKKGALVGLYQLLWDFYYVTGYTYQIFLTRSN